MILITGGAGFIGSYLIYLLNLRGHEQIFIIDDVGSSQKWLNLRGLKYKEIISPKTFLQDDVRNRFKRAEAIFHLGACSTTTEMNFDYLYANNTQYSIGLCEFATYNNMSFYYASSAATYGNGELGHSDDQLMIQKLRPLNPYGYSKQLFDEWMLTQKHLPQSWNGFKFFNVFGPNEYHKNEMASVVYKSFNQIKDSGTVKLFQSHLPEIKHGEQARDFVYVDDVCRAMLNFYERKNAQHNGIFNLGSGKARTFVDLVKAVYKSMNKEESIEFIPMPDSLKGQYQYFTEAKMDKFFTHFPGFQMRSLEEAVQIYVGQFLSTGNPYTDTYTPRS